VDEVARRGTAITAIREGTERIGSREEVVGKFDGKEKSKERMTSHCGWTSHLGGGDEVEIVIGIWRVRMKILFEGIAQYGDSNVESNRELILASLFDIALRTSTRD
jgi:hypothetical protein